MTERIAFDAKITADGRRLRGSIKLAGARTFRNGEWVEVDPVALMKADAKDVVARFDHDEQKVLGRTLNDTLTVTRTDQGIEWETAELPNTTYANDTLELARGGYLGGSSFEIDGLRSSFSTDPDGLRVRRYNSIKRLVDVSAVVDPAFTSSVSAFNAKENNVSENTEPVEPAPAPKAEPAPAPKAEPKAAFTLNETAEATERFARTLDTKDIEAAMDNIVAGSNGELKGIALDQYEAYAKVYGERKRVDTETKERAARMQALHDLRLGRLPKAPAHREVFESEDYKQAFNTYLRTGDRNVMQQFAQSITGDGTQGGFAVPDGFLNRIVERMKAYGGIAGVADTITTDNGQSLRWPTNDDTSNSAVIAAEGSAAGSAGADLVLDEVTLGAYSYDATGASNLPLLVSKELIQDAAFDIEAFVSRKLGERLGRKMAADFANGTGSGEPKGLFAKSADVMSASTMYAALVEHFFQVDQAYRDNARWVLGDTILTKVMSSLDDNGRPLFQAQSGSGGQANIAGTLLGKPVTLDQASASNVAFGDIAAGFIIRYVRGVTVDVDPYSNIKSRQIAFHAWARADSNVQDAFAYSVSSYSGVSADS